MAKMGSKMRLSFYIDQTKSYTIEVIFILKFFLNYFLKFIYHDLVFNFNNTKLMFK